MKQKIGKETLYAVKFFSMPLLPSVAIDRIQMPVFRTAAIDPIQLPVFRTAAIDSLNAADSVDGITN